MFSLESAIILGADISYMVSIKLLVLRRGVLFDGSGNIEL
jgi:hypothetical protein